MNSPSDEPRPGGDELRQLDFSEVIDDPAMRIHIGEMNYAQATANAAVLERLHPDWRIDVWSIAQGLAYIRIQQPAETGVRLRVIHDFREYRELRHLDFD